MIYCQSRFIASIRYYRYVNPSNSQLAQFLSAICEFLAFRSYSLALEANCYKECYCDMPFVTTDSYGEEITGNRDLHFWGFTVVDTENFENLPRFARESGLGSDWRKNSKYLLISNGNGNFSNPTLSNGIQRWQRNFSLSNRSIWIFLNSSGRIYKWVPNIA